MALHCPELDRSEADHLRLLATHAQHPVAHHVSAGVDADYHPFPAAHVGRVFVHSTCKLVVKHSTRSPHMEAISASKAASGPSVQRFMAPRPSAENCKA